MKWIKKLFPSQESLKKSRLLKWLQPTLHESPNYWKFNKTSVSRGIAIGVFNAFMPVPLQTILALIMAIPARANLILSLGMLWINNPITIVPIYIFSYRVGAWMLNEHMQSFDMHVSASWFLHQISQVWKPFLLGIVVCGLFFALISYFITLLFWKRIEDRLEK